MYNNFSKIFKIKMKSKKILVTGTSSGLGKYLSYNLKSFCLNRKKITKKILNKKWDLIIHCAYDSKSYDIKNFEKYFEDNVLLSNIIGNLNAKKKIFISTAQVYEKNLLKNRSENSYIEKSKLSTYPKSKIICEDFFKKKEDIILRVGSMVGSSMRENTISKILKKKISYINLNQESKFSFVSYNEVLEIIKILIKNKKYGIFNLLRNDLVSLKKISKCLNKKVNFGKYNFQCTRADNKRINKYFKLNNKTSLELLRDFNS